DGNGSTDLSPTHTYTAVGEYVVTLNITTDYGCEEVHQDTIFVYPQPVATIGSDMTQGCVPLTVQFENLSTGYSDWSWIIDNGPETALNPSYTYTVADTDVVVLMVDTADFCFDTTTLTIQVATPPTAAFSLSENQFCSFPALVQFTDQSQSEVSYTHFWDFGDGITSTNPNPGHTYNAIGHYEVLLVITTDYGCVDSLTDSVFIYPVPQAALLADSLQGCVPFEVNFLDQSTNASGYEWWVAGDTIFDPGFSYLFTSPPDTSFIVTLIADTADFCFDTTSIQIDIASPPLANFAPDWDQFCGVPALNSFTDLSQSTRQLQYRWEFGDGNSSVVPNPNHVYNATGEFVISLEVINDYNCRDTLLDTVNVYPIPEAAILPQPQRGCAPLEVDFLNQSSNYTHALWDFGDGSGNSLADSPSHLYTFADTSFLVKLVVDTANFCFDSTTVRIDVGSAPIANFEASLYEACGSARVQFTNLSFSAELPISYVWDLGNGITSALENPVTDYTSPGEYVVELVVRNSYECTDTLRQTITIYPQAVAMFDALPLEGCQPLEVQFSNLSTDATEWRWEMGDGSIRQEESPLHTYEQIGTYSVELIASYEGECPDTLFLEDLITVLQTPMADFVAQDSLVDGRPDGSVRFINTTLFGERYEWDFGDGSPLSYVPSPSHRYFVNDTFTVRLVAWSADNCSDTTFQQITPLLFGDLHVPNALAPFGGPGEYSVFLPKGVGLIDYHISVYSIWGDLVWESKELLDGQPAESWDGTIRGQVANSDVFVWKVHTAIFEGGRNWSGPREGSVTLIR
ncbi:MAG: PKD domain-containing protein, partial [Bacteroidota bacterium]